jgi:hypothetical protein
MNEENQIHLCYCSENLPEPCNYCQAKRAIREILNFPPQQGGEDAIERIFTEFNIAPRARLDIMFDIEGQQFDQWFQ